MHACFLLYLKVFFDALLGVVFYCIFFFCGQGQSGCGCPLLIIIIIIIKIRFDTCQKVFNIGINYPPCLAMPLANQGDLELEVEVEDQSDCEVVSVETEGKVLIRPFTYLMVNLTLSCLPIYPMPSLKVFYQNMDYYNELNIYQISKSTQ